MRAIKRENLFKEVEKNKNNLNGGDLDTIMRVAKFGKNILIQDEHLRVTFGVNLYTVVEKAAVKMVESLAVFEGDLDKDEYLPFKELG